MARIMTLRALIVLLTISVIWPQYANAIATKIYWGDVNNSKIQRANPDGSNIEDIVIGGAPLASGIALDPAGGKMYWNDRIGAAVLRSNLDGSFVETLLTVGAALKGRITLDLVGRKMYFAGHGVQRANLDGTGIEDLVPDFDVGFPTSARGIALDLASSKMYWTELGNATIGASSRRIRRANLDGSSIENLVTGLPDPNAIALDISAGKMYWSNDLGRTIQRANLDGTNVETLVPAISTRRRIAAFAIDLGDLKMYWTERNGTIRRANLDGSQIEDVLSGLGSNLNALALLPGIPVKFAITSFISSLKLGDFYSQQLEIRAGIPSFTWSLVSGALPVGINLSSDGILSGTPIVLGTSIFTLRVTDSLNDITDKTFSVNVLTNLPPADIQINKTGTQAVPGRDMEYFILLENKGGTTANDIDVFELFTPPEFFSLKGTTPPHNFADEIGVNWVVPSLASGESKVFTYRVALSPLVAIGENVNGRVCFATGNETVDSVCTAACGIDLPPPTSTNNACRKCISDHGTVSCSDFDQPGTGPKDPNEKLVVANKFIQPNQLLVYPIHFENIGAIEALDVFVTDGLDANLDLSTLTLLTPNGASVDSATSTVKWDLIGRNLLPGETGNVLFSIRPKPGLPSGTEIRNNAEIQFEVFETLVTPDVVNIIDSTPPICEMDQLLTITPTMNFTISWQGTDAVGEVDHFSVFISENGGGFTPLLEETRSTQATFSGENGKTYGFFCSAVDTAGNIENQAIEAEVTTTVVINQPPTANAGIDQTLECTGTSSNVILDGSGSSDPDGDPLTYSWTGPFGTVNGQTPTVSLLLGNHTITLSVDDGNGGADSDTVDITIEDTVAPDVTVSVSPDTLWPPNHKLKTITATVSTSDACDASPTIRLVSITSDEPDNGVGDGNTVNDIQGANFGTNDTTFQLRSERQGGGNGRTYTITYEAEDVSGNSITKEATVTVPHNQ